MNDKAKRPIDMRRDSAGSIKVGLDEEGKVAGFYQIGDERLFILKERAVYEMQMADQIDPARSNENIPTVQQRVFDAGVETDIIQAVLLQSDELLRKDFLKGIDVDLARMHAIEATGELLAMARIRDRVKAAEKEQIEALAGKKLEQGTIIPFLHDAVQDTKNFLNRSDHFMKEIQSISKIFVGRFTNWDNLLEREKKIGLEKEDYDLFLRVIRYMKFIREARNASEHPHENKKIVVRNFRLLPTAEVATPTFEFVHPKVAEPEVDLPIFMDGTIDSLMNLYGSWLALLCSRKASINAFGIGVMNLPLKRRKHPRVGYHYALPTKNGWQPLA